MRKYFFLVFSLLSAAFLTKQSNAQLVINGPGATFFIGSGAVVTLQGDLTSNVDIQGTGKILLKGSGNQNINMNSDLTTPKTIPNLEIENGANATLTGSTRIGNSLLFTAGKIFTSGFNLNLAEVATVSGMGTSKFVETNGTGQVIKELSANVTANEIPVGVGTNYRPAFITTNATGNTTVGIKALAVADPNKPPMISDYIAAYWPITRSTLTGTVSVAGQYLDADVVSGSEGNLKGYYFSGTDWNSTGEGHDYFLNRISAPITAASGDLSALDKFNLLRTKIFLQGSFNLGTSMMDDNLRSGGVLASVTSDPYRTAPYNTVFTHVNNSLTENFIGTPLASQPSANDNIVDWVFLELRNTITPGNSVTQTRSALIQRDGDIVDVDGVSPVTFNNVLSGSYTIAVRHRNHLGIGTDPSNFLPSLSETKSTAAIVDLSTATDAQIFGPSDAYTIVNGKNLLWGGNVNGNGFVRYQGSNGPTGPNDRVVLLQDLGGNETNVLNSYQRGDVNLNIFTRYQGSNGPPPAGLNDRLFILQQALGNNEITVRTQSLPN